MYILYYIYIHIIEMYMVQKIANFTKPNPQFHMHESYKITQPLWKNRH
jgi:hypothetical protein